MLTLRVSVATLILRAWIGLAVFDAARLIGFSGIHRRIQSCRLNRQRSSTPETIVWAVDEACVWYVKPAYCLQRSAVAAWLLRRHGFDASLVIGYRPLPFESHAWVEIDGRIVNDRPQYQSRFRVLERM